MPDAKIRWGILGTAKIARETLCPAIMKSTHGSFAGVASRKLDRAVEFAAPYPNAKPFGSYDEMLADPEIDAIYIPLPNTDHVAWTLNCLEAGKHVLCEKPIAMQADEIDSLIEARDRTGMLVAEAFMVTHHPQWYRVRDWISAGHIGELRHVQGVFTYFNDDPKNIRNQAALGGGALPDIGVYPCVTTRFVTGAEPVNIRSNITWNDGVDLSARVWADFDTFTMDFYVSMRMALRQNMVFHGTDGVLTVHTPFNPPSYGAAKIEIRKPNGDCMSETFSAADQYVNQFDNFHSTILNWSEYQCPLEFSKGNQRMIDMIFAGEVLEDNDSDPELNPDLP